MPYSLDKQYILIEDDKSVYRRGYPKQFSNPNGTPTSRVFVLRKPNPTTGSEGDEGKLSVDATHLITARDSITQYNKWPLGKFYLCKISVQDINLLGLQAYYEPLTVANDGIDSSAHGFIWGLDDNNEDALAGELARKATAVFVTNS